MGSIPAPSPIGYGTTYGANALPGILNSNGSLLNSNGPKNYLTNGTFANTLITGYQLGITGTLTNGLPTGTPTIGSGTTALGISSTFGTNISAFNGSYFLNISATAASTAGNGVFLPACAIDAEDRARMLQFKCSYQVGTGTLNLSGTLSNSIAVAFWDSTNSVWLSSAGNFNFVQSSGVGICTATLQTGVSTTTIYPVLYFPTASSASFNVYAGSFFLGPQITAQGPAVTDWVPYTPTFTGFGTPTSVSFQSRRVGDSLEVHGTFVSGTSTAVTAQISLGYNGANANVTSDTTKLSANATIIGSFGLSPNGAVSGYVLSYGSNASFVQLGYATSSSSGFSYVNGSAIAASGNTVSFYWLIPIVGWSSNTAMSADTDTRVVATYAAQQNPTGSLSSTPAVAIFGTVTKSTDGSYSSSTGLYTVGVTGWYRVSGGLEVNATYAVNDYARAHVYQNGAAVFVGCSLAQASTTRYLTAEISGTLYAKAGDTIALYGSCPSSSPAYATSFTGSFLSIERLSGPAVVQATESVNAGYASSAGASIPNNSGTQIAFATKNYDTHGAMNAAGTIYTCPVAGKYTVTGALYYSGTTATISDVQFNLWKNGAAYQGMSTPKSGTGSTGATVTASFDVSCVAGDQLSFYTFQNSGSALSLLSNAQYNWLSIKRIGN